jgi:peptidoglycan/xylan/chitin deacetylase (PgdA/CDA1 family)
MIRATRLGGDKARSVLAWSRRATLATAVVWTFSLFYGVVAPSEASATTSAVVFVYQRFDDSDLPGATVRADQLDEHIAELRNPAYSVLPLLDIVDRLKAGTDLPDRTIAITIDGADRSVYEQAWPRLRDAGLPFTLFIPTAPIDRGSANHMTWDEVRELASAGVTIGTLSRDQARLTEMSVSQVKQELDDSISRIEAELGKRPTLLAYPYGEYSLAVREEVAKRGFAAAFGQNSGVLHQEMDPLALSRFPLNDRYGGIDRFRLIANALPLPVVDVLPADPLLTANPPAIGFTVVDDLPDLDKLACFVSSRGRVHLERLEKRVELRLDDPLPPGRSRFNCTMPAEEGRWRWFGLQVTVPRL